MANVNLHFDDYNRIGRVQKRLHPGLYDRYTDEQVGVVAIEQGHFSPDKYLAAKTTGADMVAGILNLDNKPGWCEGLFQVGREERKNRILGERSQQASAVIEFQKKKIESLQLDFELQHLPEMLAAAEFIRELQMQFQVDMIEDQRKAIDVSDRLRKQAADKGLTSDNNQTVKVAEELSQLKLKEKAEELKFTYKDHEQRERLGFELKQKELDNEVEATIKLGNTENLARAQILSLIADYIDKRDIAKTAEKRQLYQDEIDHLRGQLKDEESSSMDGEEDAGNDPEGGASPPQSGDKHRGSKRPGSTSNSAKDSGHVH